MPATDRPIGNIMIAVAVLLTHMLRKPVAIMRPAICLRGLLPMASKIFKAIRRCKFQRCMASPMTKPPRNRKMTERSEEHTSELQSLMRTSYAVFCLQTKNTLEDNTYELT